MSYVLSEYRHGWKSIFLLLCIFTFAILCYSTIIPSYFLSDDFTLISRVSQEGMFSTWSEDTGGFFRPVTIFSYLADLKIWKLNPAGYHLTNIFFHALAGFALFLLTRNLFKMWGLTKKALPAFLTACLFVALPSHSESVSWISGRTDVISSAFGLFSLFSFSVLIQKRSISLSVLSILLFATGLLAKENIVILPLIWFALLAGNKLAKGNRPSPHSLWTLFTSFLCLLVYLLVRKMILGNFIGGLGTERHLGLFDIQSIGNLLRYMVRTFLPALPHSSINFFESHFILLVSGAAASILIVALIVRHRGSFAGKRIILFLMLAICFLICLLPVMTLKVSLFDTLSERFLYLPSAFASILLVIGVFTLIPNRTVSIIVLSVLIVLEFSALQWINTRWITAGRLSRRIAGEVSLVNPDSTVILNIPDNFQGAYVFRSGLTEASSIFLGTEMGNEYRIISTHNLHSISDTIQTLIDSGCITLVLPQFLEFCETPDQGSGLQLDGNTLIIRNPGFSSFMFFSQGSMHLIQNDINLLQIN